jgi:ribokinase
MEPFAMPAAGFDVIVCGSLHLDIIVKGAPLPRLDETAVGAEWGMTCGGKGGNQAVMAARMGARTAMIGRVGSDDFGQRLLANLDAASVDRSKVGTDGAAGSGMSVAIVEANGDYGAVIVSGANLKLDPDECARHWRALGGARALVLQNEIPESAGAAVAKAAKAEGGLVILNAAPARALGSDFLDLIDVLVVNRIEAEMMAGAEVKDSFSAMAALPALGAGFRDVIITLGGEGLVAQSRRGAPVFIAPHPVTAVSTHGAGDCFLGALSARLAAGTGIEDACAAANRAAAAFVAMSGRERASFFLNDKAAGIAPANA